MGQYIYHPVYSLDILGANQEEMVHMQDLMRKPAFYPIIVNKLHKLSIDVAYSVVIPANSHEASFLRTVLFYEAIQ